MTWRWTGHTLTTLIIAIISCHSAKAVDIEVVTRAIAVTISLQIAILGNGGHKTLGVRAVYVCAVAIVDAVALAVCKFCSRL